MKYNRFGGHNLTAGCALSAEWAGIRAVPPRPSAPAAPKPRRRRNFGDLLGIALRNPRGRVELIVHVFACDFVGAFVAFATAALLPRRPFAAGYYSDVAVGCFWVAGALAGCDAAGRLRMVDC